MTSMTPNQANSTALFLLLAALDLEIRRADEAHGPIHSAHEGYGIIAEEFAELFDEVRKKTELRSRPALLQELLHTAATCIRTAQDLGLADCLDGATVDHLHLRLKGWPLRLMLAAPEMLAALEVAEDFVSGFDDEQTITEELINPGVVEQIRTAIAKAKGEDVENAIARPAPLQDELPPVAEAARNLDPRVLELLCDCRAELDRMQHYPEITGFGGRVLRLEQLNAWIEAAEDYEEVPA